jgi:Zn-dependent protease
METKEQSEAEGPADRYVYVPAIPAGATNSGAVANDRHEGRDDDGQGGSAASEATVVPYGYGRASQGVGWVPVPLAGAGPERIDGPFAGGPASDQTRGEGGTSGRGGSGIGKIIGRTWPLLLLLLTKAKWLTVLFKFKAFSTFSTMLLSIGAYALFWGLPFAIGFVVLLLIHEMGHALVLKRQGVKATAPLFIPFMGAVIGMKEMPKNVFAEAQMALGGPILGSLGALACLMLWQVTGSSLFLALAYTGFLLNLFNLIPISPLDGGRAMAAISPWGWLLGIALGVIIFLRFQSLILGFILVVGTVEVVQRWRGRREDRAYYEATGRQRLAVSAVYLGLAVTLALLMAVLQPELVGLRPGR